MVFTTEWFLEKAIEGRPEWDLNTHTHTHTHTHTQTHTETHTDRHVYMYIFTMIYKLLYAIMTNGVSFKLALAILPLGIYYLKLTSSNKTATLTAISIV